ncbi:uncharacterized protein ISCGN_021449 [Ixodes scapularis]
MSRLPLLADPQELQEKDLPEIIASLEELDNGLVSAKQMAQMTAEDKTLRSVISYNQRRWTRKLLIEQEGLRPFWSRKDELSVHHSLLYWGNRVVVPKKAREAVLKLLHETHQGASAMKAVTRSKFWWTSLDSAIVDLTQRCETCIQAALCQQHRNLSTGRWPVNPG